MAGRRERYGADAVSPEIAQDNAYLGKVRGPNSGPPELRRRGGNFAYGEPSDEIIKWVEKKGFDLVAMRTHGQRFIADLFLGSTSRRVRHSIRVPVLLLKAK